MGVGEDVGEGAMVAVAVAVGVAIGVAVAVAVAVAVGVDEGVGVAVEMTHAPTLEIVSMRHPVADTLSSEAMRNRNLIICPSTFDPKFTTVLM